MMILVAMEQDYVVPVDWQWGVRVDMPILLTWPGASATYADADVDACADADANSKCLPSDMPIGHWPGADAKNDILVTQSSFI